MGICASTQISGRALVGEDEGSDAPARPRSAKSFFFLLGKTESDAEEPTEEDLLAGDANDAPIKFKTGTSFFYQAFGGRADRSSFKKPPPQPEETKVEVDIDRKKERAAPIASGMDAEDNFGRVVGTSLDGFTPDGEILSYDAYGPSSMPGDLTPHEPELTKKGKPKKKASFAEGPGPQKPRRLASAKAGKSSKSFYFYGSHKKFESFKVDPPPEPPVDNTEPSAGDKGTALRSAEATDAGADLVATKGTVDSAEGAAERPGPKGTSMDAGYVIAPKGDKRSRSNNSPPVEQI